MERGLPSPGTCGKDGTIVAETDPSGSRDGLVGRKQDGRPLLREPELRIKQDQRVDGKDAGNREGAEAHGHVPSVPGAGMLRRVTTVPLRKEEGQEGLRDERPTTQV